MTGDETPRKPLRNSMGVQGANHPRRMGTVGWGWWFGGKAAALVNVMNVLHADDDLRLGGFSHACSLSSGLPSVEFEDTDDLRLLHYIPHKPRYRPCH